MNIERLEELIVEIADGGRGAVAALQAALSEMPEQSLQQLASKERERWSEAVEIILTDEPESCFRPSADLLHEFLRIGYDSPRLRDRLADQARVCFSEYPDPAGLLLALGIRNAAVAGRKIPSRWRLFEHTSEGNLCCHPHHGRGSILEIDGLGNEVRVHFERTIGFSLSVYLEKFHLIRHGSLVSELIQNRREWAEVADMERGELRRQLADSFFPAVESDLIFRRCLVSGAVGEREFEAWCEQAAKAADERELPVAVAAGGGVERELKDTRSLQELKEILSAASPPAPSQPEVEALNRLLQTAASRPEQAAILAETLLLLAERFDWPQWLSESIGQLGQAAAVWHDTDLFVEVADGLPAKSLPDWFRLTGEAVGAEAMGELCLRLPLKSWLAADRVLARLTGDKSFFMTRAATAVGGRASADLVVWLWQRGSGEERAAIGDSSVIFRALARHARGSFLKAQRQLRSLLLQDEDFQRFLMNDGEPAAIGRLVNCVRNYGEVLEAGERQSLLVRFARLYPEARKLIEKRPRRAADADGESSGGEVVTSTRGYEKRRRELHDIVRKRIPANSRAIAHARSYGDLRENAEYKAAKEEQGHLMARRAELEVALKQVKPTNFDHVVNPSRVVPGCTVRLRLEDGESRQFHVLGCWDSDPYREMVAYETPLGRALLGKIAGDRVETPMGAAEIEAVSGLDQAMREWVSTVDDL